MDITHFYRPPQPQLWQGRQDVLANEYFHQVVTFKDWQEIAQSTLSFDVPPVFFLGFCCDEGIRRNQGRVGAKKGPAALRSALGKLPVHSKGKKPIPYIDVGDIVCEDDRLEEAQAALGYVISHLVALGGLPVVLGGGHETAWGQYLGLSHLYGKKDFAIVNFDAHFDMREDKHSTSGTPFLQIAEQRKAQGLAFNYYCLGIKSSANSSSLFKTASKWDVKYLTCSEMYASPEVAPHFVNALAHKHDALYVSICLDVFAASIVPGVSAASPYGLQPWQVLTALKPLAASSKVVAFDVVELAPDLDQGDISAKMGALCIASFLYHWQYKRV